MLIEKMGMLKPGDKVLIGVSGGPDSIALLHVLWVLKDDLQIVPVVAHLNHQLRGEEAEEDARSVREFSKKLELPCYIEEADVKSYHKNSGLSLQEACREIRFSFFGQLAGKLGAGRVALGHHADDQAETILLNFLRGAGISGLKGISYVRGLFIRPLLEIRRKEIEEYCLQQQLPVRQDSSNLKPVYTRNRIRLNLLPLLEREYNPQIIQTLVQLGNLCSEE
ncbi:MAG TPA: tRNA lysidine(34) synthetase TilS, partial [Desulfotomaculum sp.]|nr:tRNA lysidine(34) synthetase TilS [Desulfotomaculum sp.]